MNMVSALIKANRISNPEPPPFDPSFRIKHKFRFTVTANVNLYEINTIDVANLLGVVTSITDEVYTQTPLITRFRIRRIALYAIGATVTLSLQNNQSNGLASTNTELTRSDTSESPNFYAYVAIKPTPTSSAGQWQSAVTNGGGFIITAPQNAVVDLTLDLWLNNGDPIAPFGVNGLPTTTTGITDGMLLVNPLDPSGLGDSLIWPIGYNNPYSSSTPTPRP